MPRSAADRAFGFKAKGLVRILLAADPAEILIALSELGLVVQVPATLFSTIQDLVGDLLLPFESFIDAFEAGVSILERAIAELEADPGVGLAGEGDATRAREAAASSLNAFLTQLEADAERVEGQRAVFRARLDALETQTEEDIGITFL